MIPAPRIAYGDNERISRWVAAQCGDTHTPPAYQSIGAEDADGNLVAGVYFDNMSDTNIQAHIAVVSPGATFAGAVLRLAFVQLGVERITMPIYDNNDRCIALAQQLGAVLEHRMRRGHRDGDTLLYVLWRDSSPLQRRLIDRLNRKASPCPPSSSSPS